MDNKLKLDVGKWKNMADIASGSDTAVKSSINMINWAAEFTKKIVTITFIIFVISNFFVMAIILGEYMTIGTVEYLDTLITEIHTTFRDVIGGYIVKAAMENVSKIGFSVLSEYLEARYDIKNLNTDNSEDSFDGDDSNFTYNPSMTDDPMARSSMEDEETTDTTNNDTKDNNSENSENNENSTPTTTTIPEEDAGGVDHNIEAILENDDTSSKDIKEEKDNGNS